MQSQLVCESGRLKRYGLRKFDRILKHSDYILLSTAGRTVRDNFFIVVFSSSSSDRSRLGITVSKRVGNAVTRNRLKRLIREVFRTNREFIKGHRDIHIIAKATAAGISYPQARQSLKTLFGKIQGNGH